MAWIRRLRARIEYRDFDAELREEIDTHVGDPADLDLRLSRNCDPDRHSASPVIARADICWFFRTRLLARSLLCSQLVLPRVSSTLPGRSPPSSVRISRAVDRRAAFRQGRAKEPANVSDPHEHLVLTLPVRNVFALQVREHDDMILVRLVGFHDEEAVPETHAPPLPEVVEMNFPPYRRLPTDVGR